mmetsp:Transcript_76414/g.151179  ORF Transcript_76414/g.151179 Transcript_76414/m.151179 type:complete len:1081 (+) Transcript_76414:77-3319(+)
MGQGDIARCANRRDGYCFQEERPQTSGCDFVDKTLQRCQGIGVLDRFDLTSRLSMKEGIFAKPDGSLKEPWILSSDNGDGIYSMRRGLCGPKQMANENTICVDLPTRCDYCRTECPKKSQYVIRIVCTDTPQLPPLVRRVDTKEALVQELQQCVSIGVESMMVTIGQELFSIEFDPSGLVVEHESHLSGDDTVSRNLKIISSYAWMVLRKYQFRAQTDVLRRQCDKVDKNNGNMKLEAVIEEMRKSAKDMKHDMRSSRVLKSNDVERFLSAMATFSCPPNRAVSSELYMACAIQNADERRFTAVPMEEEQKTTENESGQARSAVVGPSGVDYKKIKGCVDGIMKNLKEDISNPEKWEIVVGWECLQALTAQDALHEATRCEANENTAGFARYCMKAARFAAEEGRMYELQVSQNSRQLTGHHSRQHQAKPRPSLTAPLTEIQQETVFAGGKAMLDSYFEKFLSGNLKREAFLDQCTVLCDGMVGMVDDCLLLQGVAEAKQDEHLATCKRQKADYLRYLHVFVPTRRDQEDYICKLYEEAKDHAMTVRHRTLAGVAACINHAIFTAEVRCDFVEAAQILRSGITEMEGLQVQQARGEDEVSTVNPSDYFAWNLIHSNCEAFESRIVILQVSFELPSWNVQLSAAEAQHITDPKDLAAIRPSVEPQSNIDACESPPVMRVEATSPKPLPPEAPVSPTLSRHSPRECGEVRRTSNWLLSFAQPPPEEEPVDETVKQAEEIKPNQGATQKPRLSVPGMIRPPPPLDSKEEITVRRWLCSKPACRRRGVETEQDPEQEGDRTVDNIVQVRWIDHVEEGGRGVLLDHERHEGETTLTRAVERFQQASKKVSTLQRHASPFRKQGKAESTKTFLLGCVVRVNPHNQVTSQKRAEEALRDKLEAELTKKSVDLGIGEGVKTLTITKPEFMTLANYLDLRGVVQGTPPVAPVGDSQICPGDILQWPDGTQGDSVHDRCSHQLDKANEKGESRVKLSFLPSLQVHTAKIVAAGPYTDTHKHFSGFPGSSSVEGKLLKPCNNDFSYQFVIREMKAFQEQASQRTARNKVPRRIAALSARRNPIQAAKRGCQ